MTAEVRVAQKLPTRQTQHLTIACLVLTAITSAAASRMRATWRRSCSSLVPAQA